VSEPLLGALCSKCSVLLAYSRLALPLSPLYLRCVRVLRGWSAERRIALCLLHQRSECRAQAAASVSKRNFVKRRCKAIANGSDWLSSTYY
jgi:hypothetical protein